MKKEIAAALLLLLLFAGTLVNIRVNDGLIAELEDTVDRAYIAAQNGDWDSAKKGVEAACRRWESLDGYTHVFIRHSEIGTTTDALYSMLSSVCAEDIGDLRGSYGLLRAQLRSLSEMEHISIGSIF